MQETEAEIEKLPEASYWVQAQGQIWTAQLIAQVFSHYGTEKLPEDRAMIHVFPAL